MTDRPLNLVADVRRLLAQDEAEWIKTSSRLAADLVKIANPADRAAKYADVTARLAALGEALLPADEARVRASFIADDDEPHPRPRSAWTRPPSPTLEELASQERQAAAQRVKNREEREKRDRESAARTEAYRQRLKEADAKRELERRQELARRWLAWGAVPAAATLPPVLASIVYGWGPGDVFVSLLNLPWMLGWPVMVAAVCVALIFGVAVWVRHKAEVEVLFSCSIVLALSVIAVAALRELPVYVVGPGVVSGDGIPMTGMTVALSPGFDDQTVVDVLWGVDRAPRGFRFTITGSHPERVMRGR